MASSSTESMSSASTRTSMPMFDQEVWKDWHLRLGVILLSVLVFFPGLGDFGLWDPWEVHYGEVGRSMVERGDWISPWWGSYWQAPGQTPEGEYFFSKPVLLLWMMGIGLQLFGFSELGIRFGVAVIAAMGVVSVYLAGSHVWSRRVGLLMAGTLLTSPFWFMLGRQAQTDMPFVGMMTVALSFFMMGAFGRHRDRTADKLTWGLFIAFLAGVVLPQLHTIAVGQLSPSRSLGILERIICFGPTQALLYLGLLGVFFVSATRRQTPTRGQIYLWTFYAFTGLATMGKGLLGFALPGAIIFVYLLVSREWALLRRWEIFRGIAVAVAVGFPWYGAMFARHGGIGGAFWDRFIIHDHFKRLASGVHQTDNGSFEHFIKWLGYGVFPWGSFVPAIIARALSGFAGGERNDSDRARLFVFVWFLVAFSLFTMSSTKFHHYIFPAVPAIALLAALVLDDVLEGRIPFRTWWPLYMGGIALFVTVGFDLMSDAQHLKNMFTYKYDREWDHENWDAPLLAGMRIIFAVFCVGIALIAWPWRKRLVTAGAAILLLNGVVFAVWVLNVYMPMISPTWSQRGLWQAYYDLCTPMTPPPGSTWLKDGRYCEESAISYKLNWRGETYYTENDIIPIRNDEEWTFFKEQNGDRCFFGIMEHSRVGGFRSALPAHQRESVTVVHDDNIKFALVAINCAFLDDSPAQEVDDANGSGEASQP